MTKLSTAAKEALVNALLREADAENMLRSEIDCEWVYFQLIRIFGEYPDDYKLDFDPAIWAKLKSWQAGAGERELAKIAADVQANW